MANPGVSVVVACYNEEPVLRQSFQALAATLADFQRSWEVLFVDDCSSDGTRGIIRALIEAHPQLALRSILHESNRGRGATVSDGFRAARGDVVGYLDIDLEVHSRYIPSLVRAIEAGADVATVRRIYAFQLRSLDRYLMSRGYSWLVRRLLGTALHDTETGYKFFSRDAVLPLLEEVRDEGWFWDTEVMIRAERLGLRIEEIPGAYVRRYDKTSTVHGLRDSVRYFGRLLRFRRAMGGRRG
jgi:glycosyltransferase involved in cell wall biosynthesis